MAEKYGTIPPKFTKAWWEYFWMYYKWHTIITAFVIIAIVSTVYQTLTAPKYDVTLMYAGKNMYNEETSMKIQEVLSPLCVDADENGEKALLFSQLFIDFTNHSDVEYLQAILTKLQISLAEDDVYLYVMDKDIAQYCMGNDTENAVFAPVSDWLDADITDKETYNVNGIDYGVSLDECAFFGGNDIDYFKNHYLFLRYYPRKDQIKRQLAGYKASTKLANQILSK